MRFLERAKKLSKYLFSIFVISFIFTIYFFDRSSFITVIFDNYTDDLRGTILMLICLMISTSSLIAGISLNRVIKELQENNASNRHSSSDRNKLIE